MKQPAWTLILSEKIDALGEVVALRERLAEQCAHTRRLLAEKDSMAREINRLRAQREVQCNAAHCEQEWTPESIAAMRRIFRSTLGDPRPDLDDGAPW